MAEGPKGGSVGVTFGAGGPPTITAVEEYSEATTEVKTLTTS